jgi:hypothetical protein
MKHFPGVRALGLMLFCFCICFVLRIMYCATLPPDDDFTVFEEENEKHKNGFFSCPPGDLHPKRSP